MNTPRTISPGIVLLLTVAGVMFLLFELPALYYGDDLWYTWIQEQTVGYPTRPVEDLGDIVESQYNQYMTVNSRVWLNGMAQVVVSFCPKWVFDVMNTLVFLLTLALMARQAMPGTWRRNPAGWLMLTALLFLAVPSHYETFVWATGSINYLWGGCAMLVLLQLWEHVTRHEVRGAQWALLVPAGVLLGWSHEGYIVGLVAGCAIDLMVARGHRSRASMIYGGALVVGAAFLLMAPAIWRKLGDEVHGYGIYITEPEYAPEYSHLLLPVLLFVGMGLTWKWRRRVAHGLLMRYRVVLTGVACAVVVALATGAQRAFVCGAFLSVVPLTYLALRLFAPRSEHRMKVVSALCAMVLMIFTLSIYREHLRVEAQHRQLIERYVEAADGTVVMDFYEPHAWARPYVLNLYSSYFDAANAGHLAQYYGKPLINLLQQWVVDALDDPDAFFTEAHRVPGTAGLYTLPHLYIYVWPCDATPADVLHYSYAPVSWHDDTTLPGRLRRALFPSYYPPGETLPAYRGTLRMPDGTVYDVVYKDVGRTVVQIDVG